MKASLGPSPRLPALLGQSLLSFNADYPLIGVGAWETDALFDQ